MKGLQKLQEEIQKQGEMISISLTCPMNNWIVLRSLRGLGVFWSNFFSLVTGFEEWQIKQKDGPNEWDGFQLWQVRAVYK